MDVSCNPAPESLHSIHKAREGEGEGETSLLMRTLQSPESCCLSFIRQTVIIYQRNRTQSITATSPTLKDAYFGFTTKSHSQNGIILEKLDF